MTASHSRDRDSAGRPRNARPRDELGRPLPHGVPGVPTTPDDLVLTPDAALDTAQRLLDAGRPFHAHEILEGAWKAAPEAERELWRGLAQMAVGLTHAHRGNHLGAARLLTRAADRIAAYADQSPYGVAVTALTSFCRQSAGRLDRLRSGEPMPAVTAPRLRDRPDPPSRQEPPGPPPATR
ncbi:DUF309 domain-containing protein [Solwaraspora sp. WMMD406]|uniref:DUF309 domain-containing protein n=1 Tax=Solwaraspora sp. WMMD406 TaxID=3016095 RepID=UPI002417582E|nr:DUF309 domain-containing protein [Solwaraspora sp. WMMD406]MDG4767137.1 DUF309 domain-containing protein [Solwaraspora sp. WMMD406]